MSYVNLVRPGLANASSYMSSGMPWLKSETITGAVTSYEFPNVTKFVTIMAHGTGNSKNLKIAFSENGLSTNYFTLYPGEQVTLEVKVKEIFMTKGDTNDIDISICAGLTNIDAVELTSNWSGSAGVG